MGERRVIRDAPTVTLETPAPLTGKADGGAAENYKVPGKARKLIALEVSLAPEVTLAITENNLTVRLQGDGVPGGPWWYPIGHIVGSGTTSGMAMSIGPPFRIPVDRDVLPNGAIDADVFATGDTLIVCHVTLALVFEE